MDAMRDAAGPLRSLPETLQASQALDPAAEALTGVATSVAPAGSPLNTLLSGTATGHPAHPPLTDVTLGALTSAVILDWLGGRAGAKAADRLIALGLLSAAPTVLSGLNDFATIGTGAKRIGVVHASANATSSALFALSWVQRKRGHRLRGRITALAGLGAATLGGLLGGDLAYRRRAGVDHSSVPSTGDWVDVAAAGDLGEGSMQQVTVAGEPVMLVRHGGHLYALADRCSHQGGPLSEGKLEDDCVVCPWHSSRFRLADGAAMSGPTAHPQPTLEVRERERRVELRR